MQVYLDEFVSVKSVSDFTYKFFRVIGVELADVYAYRHGNSVLRKTLNVSHDSFERIVVFINETLGLVINVLRTVDRYLNVFQFPKIFCLIDRFFIEKVPIRNHRTSIWNTRFL